LNSLEPVRPTLRIDVASVKLSDPEFNGANCVRQVSPWLAGYFGLTGKLKMWLPTQTLIWSIQLGQIKIATWPGEPTSEVGKTLRQKLGKETWIFGLTNDYLGYFTTPIEYMQRSYEACFNFYGISSGGLLIGAHERLARKSY
jgi:hypothetical protein